MQRIPKVAFRLGVMVTALSLIHILRDPHDGADLGTAEPLHGSGGCRVGSRCDALLGTTGRAILGHAILHLDQSFTLTRTSRSTWGLTVSHDRNYVRVTGMCPG